MNLGSYPRLFGITPRSSPSTIRDHSRLDSSTIRDHHTYRRQVVIKTSSRSGWPCGNKSLGISESKARIEGGSAAATRPSTPPFPERGIVRPGPRRQGGRLRLASRPGLLRAEPGDSLFMRERGELQGGEISTRTQLHKGTVAQPAGGLVPPLPAHYPRGAADAGMGGDRSVIEQAQPPALERSLRRGRLAPTYFSLFSPF